MKPRIPLIDLSEQYRALAGPIKKAVCRVLDSQKFVLSESVRLLEKKAARFLGTRYAVSVASGTDALYLTLWALGIGKGDEVITTPFSFYSSATCISRLGAKPVFVDIDPVTFNLDPLEVRRRLTRKTKAILPVHLFGLACDMTSLMRLAERHSLYVVEDAAQAFGARYGGRRVGSIGDAGCFSFYPTKNLGGAGDGGLVTTSSRDLAAKIRLLRDHGSVQKYHHSVLGINSRLDEIQAAVLLVKLKHIDAWNRRRARIAGYYARQFKGLPLQLPQTPNGCEPIYHLYSMLTARRDGLKKHLLKNGIGCGVYYPLPLHLQKCYRELGYRRGNFPVAEAVSRQILSIPVYPELADKDLSRIASAVKTFFRKAS